MTVEKERRPMNKRIVSYALLTIALGLITVGIFRAEFQSVLQKAVYICLECIGIG